MLKTAIKLAIAGSLVISASSAHAFFQTADKPHSYIEKPQCYGNILHVGDVERKVSVVKKAGKDVPLNMAIHEIIPSDWNVEGNVKSRVLVSWKKGMPWYHTLWHVVGETSGCVTLNWDSKTVYLNNTDFVISQDKPAKVEKVKGVKHHAKPKAPKAQPVKQVAAKPAEPVKAATPVAESKILPVKPEPVATPAPVQAEPAKPVEPAKLVEPAKVEPVVTSAPTTPAPATIAVEKQLAPGADTGLNLNVAPAAKPVDPLNKI